MDAANRDQVEVLTNGRFELKHVVSTKSDVCHLDDVHLSGNDWASRCQLEYLDGFQVSDRLREFVLASEFGERGFPIAAPHVINPLLRRWRPSCSRLARCYIVTPRIVTDKKSLEPFDDGPGEIEIRHVYRSQEDASQGAPMVWLQLSHEYFYKTVPCKEKLPFSSTCTASRSEPFTAFETEPSPHTPLRADAPPSNAEASPSCESEHGPAVFESAGTPLERFAEDPFYETVHGVGIGEAKLRSGNPSSSDQFTDIWCRTAVRGASFQMLFDALGLPNVNVGRYSVWEIESTRYFAEFDAAGNLERWAKNKY